MKQKKMSFYCMSDKCDFEYTGHSAKYEGRQCPKCSGPLNSGEVLTEEMLINAANYLNDKRKY